MFCPRYAWSRAVLEMWPLHVLQSLRVGGGVHSVPAGLLSMEMILMRVVDGEQKDRRFRVALQ